MDEIEIYTVLIEAEKKRLQECLDNLAEWGRKLAEAAEKAGTSS